MSWFDAAGLANIAKSALKEAQRTIDKALDIKEDGLNSAPANTPVDPNSEDFFGTWGIAQPSSSGEDKKSSTCNSSKDNKISNSIWGSFTGSFFENENEVSKSDSITSLDDTLDGVEHFSQSKLVVQNVEDINHRISDHTISEELDDENEKVPQQAENADLIPVNLSKFNTFL